VLKDAQLEISRLRVENKELKLANASLTAKSRGGSQTRKTQNRGTTGSAEDDELVMTLGKKFAVMHELWVESSAFLKPRPPNIEADSTERFTSDEQYDQGIIAELYDVVPPKLHGSMENQPAFGKLVRLPSHLFRTDITQLGC
jgi:hypothetical protein